MNPRTLRRRLVVTLAVALGGGLLLPPVARADAPADAAALKQFEDGRAAFEKGEFASALALFNSSLKGLPSPNTRLYIARCQRSLGRIASAFTEYKRAAHEAADRLNATGEKRYGATRDAAQAEAAEIEKQVPHLTIALPSGAPPSTVVRLDGADVPTSAIGSLDVDPGTHAVSVTAPRTQPFSKTIDLPIAGQQRVDVVLARLPTAVVKLALKAKPAGLAVTLDGHPVDPTRLEEPQELDVGAHEVVVRAPGYTDFVWKQSLADGDRKNVDVDLEPEAGMGGGGTPKWLFFGVAGLSLVGLGVASVFAIDATSRSKDEKAKDPLQRDPAQQDKIKSESTTANVLFIGGAAVAAGAGVLAFTTNWKGSSEPPAAVKASARVRFAPFAAPSGAGVFAAGSF